MNNAALFPRIPNYRIEKLLGRGGMADVYLGVQENLDRPVAIKILAPELLRDENFAKRFIKEAQTAAKLSYPVIMHVYDVGQTEGAPYIVMEYLPCGSLKEAIQKGMSPE